MEQGKTADQVARELEDAQQIRSQWIQKYNKDSQAVFFKKEFFI